MEHSRSLATHPAAKTRPIGYNALHNTTGNSNTASGIVRSIHTAGGQNTANTAIGDEALSNNTTGGGNIAFGFSAGQSHDGQQRYLYRRERAGNNVDNSCYIGNIFGATFRQAPSSLIQTAGLEQ